MDIKIEYENFVTPFLERVLKEKPKWMGSALKSAGWWAQKEIKAGIKSGAPGGQKYARLMPTFLRRRLEKTNRIYKSMGRLVRAVGYDKGQANKGVVPVGWLSHSAVLLGSKQEKGFFTEVTDSIRGKFAAAGIPLSPNKTRINIPARPTFKPMRPIVEIGATSHFQKKLADYLLGATERSKAKSRRKYKVYR